MIRKFLGFALVIALSLTAVVAQQPTSSTTSVERLRQVIAYLASDALEGRRTGTPGAEKQTYNFIGQTALAVEISGPCRTRTCDRRIMSPLL